MSTVKLKGITWNHSRGIIPLLATAQRFSELHPGIEINWDKRSLQSFADYPLEKLTESYDLLIIDHPWVGRAAALKAVVALDTVLDKDYLNDQLRASVGKSYQSYFYDDHQWAIPIDAATPVASYREDLFHASKVEVPCSWSDLIQLAEQGKVLAPSIPIDLLMNFYTFCIAVGEEPFISNDYVVKNEKGREALLMMDQLWSLLDKKVFDMNPIEVAELMSQTNDYWYCPFAYGYSNYSRRGYAANLLKYSNIVCLDDNTPLLSTLGGAGIAISTSSEYIKEAAEYMTWVCSGVIQNSLYVDNGGQPCYADAWLDKETNARTNNFFSDTLQTLREAFVRPRYNGYLNFQDNAGDWIRNYLMKKIGIDEALQAINEIYKSSRTN